MSEQNVAIVKRGWEHFQATGEPPAMQMYAEPAEAFAAAGLDVPAA
jgi:hypothetical protein